MAKYCRAGHAADKSMAHARCVLDTKGYKHIRRICNTYCFSTATVVAITLLNVTLRVHCLLLNTKLGPFSCKRMCSTPLYHKIAHRYHQQHHHHHQQRRRRRRRQQQQQQQQQQGFRMLLCIVQI